MPRFKRSMAVFAAVAATALVAVAPAGAQDIELDGNFSNPCVADPTIPGCVDYTFDTVDWTIDTGRNTYNHQVQPVLDDAACAVWHVLDPDDCPTRGAFPILPAK
jgi:hypothetical protein